MYTNSNGQNCANIILRFLLGLRKSLKPQGKEKYFAHLFYALY